jgi:hypothetical protein
VIRNANARFFIILLLLCVSLRISASSALTDAHVIDNAEGRRDTQRSQRGYLETLRIQALFVMAFPSS